MHDLSTTLVAVATPVGRGGLGCLRIGGTDALSIAEKLFRSASTSGGWVAGKTRLGQFLDRAGDAIDHGYAVHFAQGKSYSGDSTVEFWTHGSPVVLDELLRGAVACGAVAAGPGEFTYRALRNGRIDLPRAEAIHDLIEARTVYQARVAHAQAEGALSLMLSPLRDELEEWIARSEAAVEFVDESETHLDPVAFRQGLQTMVETCRRLLDDFQRGKVVREGVQLAIVGAPNVGKSSLFNRLLADDRAIVTELPGTTRDLLEETVDLNGIPVRLVDTAGLRETDDPVEGEGVRRARQAARTSQWVLEVLDATDPGHETRAKDGDFESSPTQLSAPQLPPTEMSARKLTVFNKSDRLDPPPPATTDPLSTTLFVSARTGAGIEALRDRLFLQLTRGQGQDVTSALGDPLLTHRRHADGLERAVSGLEAAIASLDAGHTEEWVLEDLRTVMGALAELTGVWDVEDLYDRVFSTFCIGK